jgi:hypothetical protein
LAVATAASCTTNINGDINIPNATVNVTTSADVDINNVMPEQTIPVMLTVTNVYLIDPMMTPPPEPPQEPGHVRIYLDDVATPPLVITAEVNVSVKIPAETKPGKHRLICRVHKHDGTPTSTKQEIEINVKVSVTTGDGGGTDVNVTVDANTTPADGGTGGTGG